MRLRKSYIVEDQVLDAAGTVIKNLDFSSPIASIVIAGIGKKHDHANINPLIARNISKIEIVDGTDVLYSTNMEMAQALELYASGRMPINVMSCNSNAVNASHVKISFGRHDSDQAWAFDPRKFTNPQLRITYAFTEGAGYWKDNEQKITIYANLMEDYPGEPSAFLMTKDVYSWAKASSGDETIDMDRNLPYRLIIVSTKDALTPTFAEISKIKISCDMDRVIPINQTTEDLAWENARKYGMLTQQIEVIGDAVDEDKNAFYPFAWNWGASIECWNSGANCKVKRPYSGYITIRGAGAAHASAAAADEALADGQRAIVTGRGYELHFSQVVPFGNLKDPEEFFDPREFKSVRLVLTQAQTAAIVSRVITQQLRSY